MKYKIGDRFYCNWQPKDEEPNCKIEFITTDGRYGLSDSTDEYANQYEVIDEQKLERDYVFYEEPKELYIVDARHECCVGILNIEENPKWCARLIELGLGFETKEEAEKAVEKLKAWKRLEKEGVRFCDWFYHIDEQKIKIKAEFKEFEEVVVGQKREDLDLLFGGEE